MFAEERRQAILGILAGESRVEVAELATRFDVSVDTVRRDLRALASSGVFRKTHGGAVSMNVGSLDWNARALLTVPRNHGANGVIPPMPRQSPSGLGVGFASSSIVGAC